MKSIATWFGFLFIPFFLAAQTEETVKVPRLTKMAIGQSGCSAYFPQGMPDFNLSKSEDSSEVYTSEVEVDGYLFSCITVKFGMPFTDTAPEDLETLLISYMDFLKTNFNITTSAGVGRGHTLESAPDARGVIDFWEDADSLHYAVKGWVNEKYLGIMFIYGEDDYPHLNLQQMYLDGFRFGE